MVLVKVNEDGDTLMTVNVDEPNKQYVPTGLTKTHDNGVVVVSYLTNTITNTRDYSLIKINQSHQIEFSKTYGDTLNSDQALDVIRTYDNGFLMVGQSVFPLNSDAEMYAVKTDSAGNFEWEQYYGGGNFEAAYSAIQTPDSGYLVLGWTQSYGNGQEDYYLVRTDKAGNQQWQKTYGTSQIDIAISITATTDGNYLISGASGGGVSNGLVKKINPDGIVIWSKNYTHHNNSTNDIWKIIELPDRNIVACGMTDISDNAGWLMKADSLGNQIWSRMYDKSSNTELFYDLIQTDDNGFLLCGQAWNDANSSQDAWLLKVDSLGCAYEDCTVGIDEAGNKKVLVNFYPNPVKEKLTVELAEGPPITMGRQNTAIKFFDITGREVLTYLISTRQASIDVTEFAAGVYTAVLLQNEGVVARKKIIIE